MNIRSSKTDQEGANVRIPIPHTKNESTCPVLAVNNWIEKSQIQAGPLFRPVYRGGKVADRRLSPKTIWDIVKRSTGQARMDPDLYGPHSLRNGAVTQSLISDVEERVVQKMTRHRDRASFDSYVKEADLFRNNAASKLGL